VESLKKSAERYQAAFSKAQAAGSISPQSLEEINAGLVQVQRAFLSERGLPERPWFKHQVYAPGAYTGYGAKPLAAVREYMDKKQWADADGQVPKVAEVLEGAAAKIGKVAEQLEAAAAGH